jgi:hypothetical protein
MLNHSQLLSLMAFQSATSEAWPDTVHVNSLAFLLLSGYSTFSHSPNTALPPLSTQPFSEQSAYMPIFYTLTYCNPFESVYSLFGAACNSLSLLKKTVNCKLCFFFAMRNPAIFYKRSDTAFPYTIPESNSLCRYEPSFSFSWPLFLFRSTHNFCYRYSRGKKYAKWEF